MNVAFYVSALVAIAATAMVITRANVVHALLYLVVSLLAVALVFLTLGAPLVAALEVIIYAGAIMVLFVFVMMMLNLGPQATAQERGWLSPGGWIGPGVLGLILAAELVSVFRHATGAVSRELTVRPEQVGTALFGTYLLGVELASMLLLAGVIGAYYLGRRTDANEQGERHNDRSSS
jgi:NADH-quinone oxidoreductase subunit J